MDIKSVEISDSVVLLRPFTPDLAEEHIKNEDEELVRWLSKRKSTIESVTSWIERNTQSWLNDGPIFNFAVFEINTGLLVGMAEANTDYMTVEGLEKDEVNISYGLYAFARGKGYAGRAVELIIDFLKQKGYTKVVIRVNPGNKNSIKVPLRLGFTQQKIIHTTAGNQLLIFKKNI